MRGKQVVSHLFVSFLISAKDFITCLLQVDPKRRYTCRQAVAHPWYVYILVIFASFRVMFYRFVQKLLVIRQLA